MSELREDAVWDVVVVGGANTDYFVRGPRLPRPGETVQGDTSDEAVGGKGANRPSRWRASVDERPSSAGWEPTPAAQSSP